MNSNEINADTYKENMEQFLLILRGELEMISREYKSDSLSLDDLDRYLLAINSFYYRSFHEKFWPAYQKDIQDQVQGLLGIKMQESLLIKYISAVIKRNANIFNQVKTLIRHLQQLKQQIMENTLSISDEADRQVIELLYAIKEIRTRLGDLDQFLQSLRSLGAQLESWPSDQHSHQLMLALRPFCSPSLACSEDISAYYRMLEKQQLIGDLLKKCSQEDNILTQRLTRIGQLLLDSEGPEALKDFFQLQIQSPALQYTELISLNLSLGNTLRVQELVLKLQNLFSAWLKLLHLLAFCRSNPALALMPNLYLLQLENPDYLEELYYDLSSTLKSIDRLNQDMDNTTAMDFVYFSQELQNILEFSVPLFKAMAQESPEHQLSWLASGLQQINYAFQAAESRLKMLVGQQQQVSQITGHSQEVLKHLEAQIEILNNIQHDLERLLTPRNLSRIWRDFEIRVTHIPLARNQILPDEYLYLLDKYHINTRITEKDDNTVLYEEGDIFLIRVEDDLTEEIPYFIIGKKG